MSPNHVHIMYNLRENASRCDYPVNTVNELRSKNHQGVLKSACDAVTFPWAQCGMCDNTDLLPGRQTYRDVGR